MRPVVRYKPDAVHEVGPRIRIRQIDGSLRSCDRDRLEAVPDQVGQGGCRVSHGICPVADHESVVLLIMLLNDLRQGQPLLPAYVRAVQTERLQDIDPADFFPFGNIG